MRTQAQIEWEALASVRVALEDAVWTDACRDRVTDAMKWLEGSGLNRRPCTLSRAELDLLALTLIDYIGEVMELREEAYDCAIGRAEDAKDAIVEERKLKWHEQDDRRA